MIYIFYLRNVFFTKTIHFQTVLDSKRLQLGLSLFSIDAEYKAASGRLIAARG